MAAWRTLATAAILLSLAGRAAGADKVALAEKLKEGDCFQLRLDMTFKGEIKVSREDKPVKPSRASTASTRARTAPAMPKHMGRRCRERARNSPTVSGSVPSTPKACGRYPIRPVPRQ